MADTTFEIDIRGLQDVIQEVKHPYDPEKVRKALRDGGFAIEALAKQTAQVDTGRLRASYTTNWDGSGIGSAPVKHPAQPGDGVGEPQRGPGDIAVVRVGSGVEYAVYVEYGTQTIMPYMTVTSAAEWLMPQIERRLMDALGD